MTWRQASNGRGGTALRLPSRSGLQALRKAGSGQAPEALVYEDDPTGAPDDRSSAPEASPSSSGSPSSPQDTAAGRRPSSS